MKTTSSVARGCLGRNVGKHGVACIGQREMRRAWQVGGGIRTDLVAK
jgi:hypothetical protein